MSSVNRRRFLKSSLSAAALSGLSAEAFAASAAESPPADPASLPEPQFVDTNVNLFKWPFRTLQYDQTEALVGKLRQHGIRQAWAGSYEALFHKNVDLVNRRLAEECKSKGEGILLPFGTVNPLFPDWEWDLQQCAEEYDMRGIRVYPPYQGFSLDDSSFRRLLYLAAEHDLLVQIAVDMEDERLQHPTVPIRWADVEPLPGLLAEIPEARVMLVNAFRHVRGDAFNMMVEETDVMFDISRLDGAGGVERLMKGNHWYIGDAPISADRLVLGSHLPFFPLENVLFKFMDSPMTEQQARKILYQNAERLLESA